MRARQQPRFCCMCGAKLVPGQRFCQCGARILLNAVEVNPDDADGEEKESFLLFGTLYFLSSVKGGQIWRGMTYTPEGAEALRNLGRDLLKCTNDMLEQDQMLKKENPFVGE